MRKFVIISKKGTTILQEVEIEYMTALTDSSIIFLKPGEWKAKVLKPESLYEKQNDGSLRPPVWCWHAFYSNEVTAREQAEADIKKEFERSARKSHTQFDVVACLQACKEIQVATL